MRTGGEDWGWDGGIRRMNYQGASNKSLHNAHAAQLARRMSAGGQRTWSPVVVAGQGRRRRLHLCLVLGPLEGGADR